MKHLKIVKKNAALQLSHFREISIETIDAIINMQPVNKFKKYNFI